MSAQINLHFASNSFKADKQLSPCFLKHNFASQFVNHMEQIRKIAKNQAWFRPIVEKARINYKAAHKELVDFDENKLTREQFRGILEHISLEAELVPPTKEEAYELFDEFNDRKVGKMEEYLEKEEFEKFCSRVFEMLNSTIQS